MISRLRIALALGLVVAAGLLFAPARAQPPVPEVLIREAWKVLEKHCVECHGKKDARAGLDVLDREALIAKGLLRPGKAEVSELFIRIASGAMPPGKRARVSPAERQRVAKWIESGAPPLPPPYVPPQHSEEYILAEIARDWKALPAAKQARARYVSLNHLLTNKTGADRLPLARKELERVIAAFAGPDKGPVKLDPIDKPQTLFRLDLEAAGWDVTPFSNETAKPPRPSNLNLFDLVLLEYPYGVVPFRAKGFVGMLPMLRKAASIRPLPYVRGDWLAAQLTDRTFGPEMLTLLGGDGKLPAPPDARVWPARISVEEAFLELGWTNDRDGLEKVLQSAGIDLGGVTREDWEKRFGRMARRLGRGEPVLPLNAVGFPDYRSDEKLALTAETVDFNAAQKKRADAKRLKKKPPVLSEADITALKPKAAFRAGDYLALRLVCTQDAQVELTVGDVTGPLERMGDLVTLRAKRPFLLTDEGDGFEIDQKIAQERWVIYALPREAVAALANPEPLSVRDQPKVRHRYVHPRLHTLNVAGTGFDTPFEQVVKVTALFKTVGNVKGGP